MNEPNASQRGTCSIRSAAILCPLACFVLSCGLALGCGRTTVLEPQQGGQGPGHREQPLALSPKDELALGRQAYQEILREVEVVSAGLEVERARHIGQRIAHAAQIEPLQREINLHLEGYRFEWEYNVVRENQINAFCLPGGKVGVFTGLLRVVQNDDQLATVMSHEVAHALAHHASERIARARNQGVGLMQLAYNRDQEVEADHIGVFLMTFAGYDPEQAVVFWERMASATSRGLKLPEILSDHPSDAHRIAKMQEWVPFAKAAKKAYDEGRIAPASRKQVPMDRPRDG